MTHETTCEVCLEDFVAKQAHTKFCSQECKKKREGEKWGRSSDRSISAGTVGAIAEMAVAVDLMEKGYAVFRALSPACLCDLIALKDGVSLRVEVRTGYKGEKEKTSFPLAPRDIGRQDIFGIYIRARKEVEYYNPSKEPVQV